MMKIPSSFSTYWEIMGKKSEHIHNMDMWFVRCKLYELQNIKGQKPF